MSSQNQTNPNINRFFNKLYMSFQNIITIDKSLVLMKEEHERINFIYSNQNKTKWFAKSENKDKDIFLFGKIKDNLPESLLTLTFDKVSVYSSECSGIINAKQVYINVKYFIDNFPDFKTELNEISIDVFVNGHANSINVIKLGEYNDNFEELQKNLNLLLDELDNWQVNRKVETNLPESEQINNNIPSNEENCEICGKKLKRREKKLCKKCSKKRHAANILTKLLKHTSPQTPFTKKDLNEIYLEREINDFIWSLQDFNLIKQNNNEYCLVEEDILNEFIEKYSFIDEKPVEKEIKKEEPKKLNKKCSICKKTLPTSKFYKSKKTNDGFEDYCKNCKGYVTAASYLKDLLDNIQPGEYFKIEDLLNNYKNTLELNGRIWKLQEVDLINYNEKTNNYCLKNQEICQEFLDKYYVAGSITVEMKSKEELNNELTKEEQMNIVIENIRNGKNEKEAAQAAGINLYKITHWFNEGKNNNGDENIDFYNRYTNAKREADVNSYKNFYSMESFNNRRDLTIADTLRKQQMESILKELGSGSSMKTAAFNSSITYETLQYWYKRGKQDFGEEYKEFYDKINILQSPIDIPKPKDNLAKKSTSEVKKINEENESHLYDDILNPIPKSMENQFKSSETNSGFAWVSKTYYGWLYTKQINHKSKTIQRKNIYDLYLEVKKQKLPWGVRDLKKAKKTLNECEKPFNYSDSEDIKINLPEQYKNILDLLPKKYAKRFKKPNSTGIAWVKKENNYWKYYNPKDNIKLSNHNIFNLYLEVKEKNLPWGVRNLKRAKETLSECELPSENELEITYEIVKNEKDIFNHILDPLPSKYLKRLKTSGTATGFSWVYKGKNTWIYAKNTKKGRITISRSNLYNLYLEVIQQNLPWGVRDFDKAKKSLLECKKPHVQNETISETNDINKETNSEVTCIYFNKKDNVKIIINGLIKNDEFMNTLYKFKPYERNIKKIISNRHTESTELFIELELEQNRFNNFEEKIKEFGWKIIKQLF